jgi:hypothetical protein
MASVDQTLIVPSSLVDLRKVPLAETSALEAAVFAGALKRLVPGYPFTQVPIQAFSSAI